MACTRSLPHSQPSLSPFELQQHNNFPTLDAGIETLYKFAGIDPFARSHYFGIRCGLAGVRGQRQLRLR